MKLIILLLSLSLTLTVSAEPTRGLKIVCSADAPPAVLAQAERLLAAEGHATLSVLSEGAPPTTITNSLELADAPFSERAFDHLVLIGMPDDPLIAKAWNREAHIEGNECYVFGFGHIQGDVGYIESNRNPFLHGKAVDQTPYETQLITITGTSPEGPALAVDAFLKQQITNGVIAAPGWKRGETTIIDRDPLEPGPWMHR